MERRVYQKKITSWWQVFDTEADSHKVLPTLFHSSSASPQPTVAKVAEEPIPNAFNVESCFIVRESIEKLYQFLENSHNEGCPDPNCTYDNKNFSIKIIMKPVRSGDPINEFKLPRKRGRRSRAELEYLANVRKLKEA
jgi:hypothetical protein